MKKEVIITIVLLLVVGGSALFAMNKFKKDAKKVEPEPSPDKDAKRIVTEHEKKVIASLDFKAPFRIR